MWCSSARGTHEDDNDDSSRQRLPAKEAHQQNKWSLRYFWPSQEGPHRADYHTSDPGPWSPPHLTSFLRDTSPSQQWILWQIQGWNGKQVAKEMNIRVVDAAVVEDEAGAGKGHTRFLGLELKLDNVMVSWGKKKTHQCETALLV